MQTHDQPGVNSVNSDAHATPSINVPENTLSSTIDATTTEPMIDSAVICILDAFEDAILSCRASANMILPLLNETAVNKLRAIKSLISDIDPEVDHKSDNTISLPNIGLFHVAGIVRSVRALQGGGTEPLERGLFIALFSFLDALLADVCRTMLKKRGETAFAEVKVSYADIARSGSLDDVRTRIIEDEVDAFLRSSYKEQFAFLSKQLGASLDVSALPWSNFVECTQRRHIAVHTNLSVNRQYLEECERASVDWIDEPPQLGVKLSINPDYLLSAISVIELVGLMTIAFYGIKLETEHESTINERLADEVYFSLLEGRYANAASLGYFLLHESRTMPHETRMNLLVNVAQSLKWSGRDNEAMKLIDGHKWPIFERKYRLAYAVLTDNVEDTIRLMKEGGTDEDTFYEYAFWPLYLRMRENEEFLGALAGHFGRPITKEDSIAKILEHLSKESEVRAFRRMSRVSTTEPERRTTT